MSVRLGLAGAGLIGARHAAAIAASRRAELVAVADPAEAGADVAAAHGARRFETLETMLDAGGLDGVILATPNQAHEAGALACISAGLPALVEKPLAAYVAGARRIAEAAEAAGVSVAVGHHRRHNPLIAKAKEMIEAGRIGRIVAAHASTWLKKPADYFTVDWRRKPGGGPLAINLIHDIDLLHHLVGPVADVQAMTANAARGHEVEDTAALLLRFANGAIGTMTVSDAAPAPWSWELTARENPAYPATDQDCYRIAGTEGALALPNLALWSHGRGGWMDPIAAERPVIAAADPLVAQIDQFAAVIEDGEPPLCSARDGLAAVEIVEAARAAASD